MGALTSRACGLDHIFKAGGELPFWRAPPWVRKELKLSTIVPDGGVVFWRRVQRGQNTAIRP